MKELESYYESKEEKEWCEREVSRFTCATHLVESVMKANAEYPHSDISDFSYEYVENAYKWECGDCGEEAPDGEKQPHCRSCGCLYINNEPVEVLEWWIVDSWMARHLKEQGEATLEAGALDFWGRTCSGQAIVLDGVLQKIYREINA